MKKEDTVKLISAEGFEFVIDKKAAMVSQTIRNMLTSPGLMFLYFSIHKFDDYSEFFSGELFAVGDLEFLCSAL